MKLPIKKETVLVAPPRVIAFDDYDAFGGAIYQSVVYVKELKKGEIVKKAETTPFRRGMIKNEVVYYYLRHGDTPPTKDEMETMIPSTW